MAKYIEREKVLGTIDELQRVCVSEVPDDKIEIYNDVFEEVYNKIAKIIAVDVRPERHGRWKWDNEGYLRCSECTQKAPYVTQYQDEPMTTETNYCPNCGALMDLDGEDNG